MTESARICDGEGSLQYPCSITLDDNVSIVMLRADILYGKKVTATRHVTISRLVKNYRIGVQDNLQIEYSMRNKCEFNKESLH